MTEAMNIKNAIGLGNTEDTQRLVQQRSHDFAQEMRDIEEAQSRGEAVPDYKFLGLIKMPAIMGAALRTLVIPVMQTASDYVYSNADKVTSQLAPKIFASAKHQNIAVRGTSVALGLGTLLSENAIQGWRNISTYKKDVQSMAASIAPVLDEIKGGHGFGAFLSVASQDNEVIYAHRRRLGLAHSKSHLTNLIGAIDKLPKLVDIAVQELTHSNIALSDKMDKATKLVASKAEWAGTTISPFVDLYKGSIEKDYNRANAKPSSLMMITALADQLKQDPTATDFEIPGARSRQVSLADYIALTFKCHQEGMAEIDASYSALRPKLDEKLTAISERLADAIQKGEINPLMLVRLVGERQVVKNGGRGLADMKHVENIIHKLSGKAQNYTQVPEKEFFENISKEDIKAALGVLKGEERQMFMATLPDNILEAEGVSSAEIKQMRDATASKYQQMLAQSVMGLAANDNKALEAMGLAEAEIMQLREAAQAISEDGVKAIEGLRTTATNMNGVEGLLHQAVTHQLQAGDIHYLGTLSKQGREAMVAAAANTNLPEAANDSMDAETASYADKVRAGRDNAAMERTRSS